LRGKKERKDSSSFEIREERKKGKTAVILKYEMKGRKEGQQ